EVYRDLESFEAHLTAPYGGPFNRALRNLIVEDGSQLTFLDRAAEPDACGSEGDAEQSSQIVLC
ncbi:hypothetical protein ACH3VR_23290, partial [Microbacterium sp. B2969]